MSTRRAELQRYRDVGSGNLPASIVATSTEINTLSGVAATLTASELNILDGVTASAADLNRVKNIRPLGLTSGTVLQAKTDNYTAALTDAGTFIDFGAASGKTFTIPANGTVQFPIGTVIGVTKSGANTLALAVTTDTLIGGDGTPTLSASGGVALFFKVAATTWVLLGVALT
jgi:hypothetical protein